MATTPQAVHDPQGGRPSELQEKARRHLWMHFTRMGGVRRRARDPDHRARRGLLRLRRARQPLPRRAVGALLRERRPRPRGARRGRRASRPRSSASTRTGATRTRWRSSWRERIATLAPGDLNRVFFTSGGSEAVESAWKLARQYHKLTRQPARSTKIISRETAYHGTTFGALSITGITPLRTPFEPLVPGALPRAEHERLPLARGPRPALGGRPDRAHDRVRGPGDRRRRDPRAGAELGRLLRAAGRLLAARARDLRPPQRAADRRRGDLLLGPPRPLLRRRALRRPAGHHHHGEGPHLRVRADGRRDRRPTAWPSRSWRTSTMFTHGITFGGHPVSAAVALANLDIFEREDLCGHVREKEAEFRGMLDKLQGGPPDRRRRARRGLLPRARAGQGQGDQGELQRRGVARSCCAASCRASCTSAG